jgi:hypothetical protein
MAALRRNAVGNTDYGCYLLRLAEEPVFGQE